MEYIIVGNWWKNSSTMIHRRPTVSRFHARYIRDIYVLWEISALKRLESFLGIPWHGRNREISRDLSLHFCAVTLNHLYGSVLHSRTRFISDRVVSRTSIAADYYIVAWRSRRRSLRSTVSENTIDFSIWYFWVNFEEVSWMLESFIDGRMTSRILCSTWEC